MPHDPQRVSETIGWLRKAAEDLRLARLALDAEAATALAREVLDAILARLPVEVRP
jgi:hypothetical protein